MRPRKLSRNPEKYRRRSRGRKLESARVMAGRCGNLQYEIFIPGAKASVPAPPGVGTGAGVLAGGAEDAVHGLEAGELGLLVRRLGPCGDRERDGAAVLGDAVAGLVPVDVAAVPPRVPAARQLHLEDAQPVRDAGHEVLRRDRLLQLLQLLRVEQRAVEEGEE